ncbi:hypothetical protein C0Q70_01284 [Pomacea canaliculata]|uniref:Uncharacterized protein n=1 Tax=Pomacea canaliculata TaxID=400727 RepID=A0A2T7PZ14_POMCA|nr:hypothetical protein C0Q70_01284 [Pomacea canaliculata]
MNTVYKALTHQTLLFAPDPPLHQTLLYAPDPPIDLELLAWVLRSWVLFALATESSVQIFNVRSVHPIDTGALFHSRHSQALFDTPTRLAERSTTTNPSLCSTSPRLSRGKRDSESRANRHQANPYQTFFGPLRNRLAR